MKKINVTAGCLLLAMSSCQRGIYIPDKVNSPGFKEAHEAKADVSIKPQAQRGSGSICSFSSDIAYAPLNHLGVILSYRGVNNKVSKELGSDKYDPRTATFNGNRIDFGLGYFNKLGESGKFEGYGGYGAGVINCNIVYDANNNAPYTNENYTARYSRYFLQGAIGFDNDKFSLMGGSRFTVQRLNDFQSSDPDLRWKVIPDTFLNVTDYSFSFIEPFIEMQIGYKYIKFNYQFGWACQVSGPRLKDLLGLPYMSIGITFQFAPRFRNKTDKYGISLN